MRTRYFTSTPKIEKPLEEKVDRLVAYLQKFPIEGSTSLVQKYEWVPKSRILTAARGARMSISEEAWMLFETLVNIGKRWNKDTREMEYTYYEPAEGDDFMQRALDEF